MDSKIIEVSSVDELRSHIENIRPHSVILLDVDDTIITPVSKAFRSKPHMFMIDRLKKLDNLVNNEEIVSNWRLQRKVILLDDKWPRLINDLKQTYQVYALTKMDTGTFGNITSMEEWRYNELKNLGIHFSRNEGLQNHKSCLAQPENQPLFFNGIFLTGSQTKGEVIDLYQEELNTDFIVMVDDRIAYLKDIQAACKRNNIGFLGVLLTAMQNLPREYNADVAEFQEQYLIKHATWLEDDVAKQMYEASL